MGFGQHQAAAEAAARLALADLATATVTEMTDLAGTMGRIYAQHQGKNTECLKLCSRVCFPGKLPVPE